MANGTVSEHEVILIYFQIQLLVLVDAGVFLYACVVQRLSAYQIDDECQDCCCDRCPWQIAEELFLALLRRRFYEMLADGWIGIDRFVVGVIARNAWAPPFQSLLRK